MKAITISIPDQLEMNDYEIRYALAIRLYETGKCSLGQAAEVVGISKRAFIETMNVFGGSVFSGYTREELQSDLNHA